MRAGWIGIATTCLVLAAPAGANTVTNYTFDSLTYWYSGAPAGTGTLTGQDNWYNTSGAVSMQAKLDNAAPIGGDCVHYGTGNLASDSGGFTNFQNYRINDAGWSFDLHGVTKFAVQCDTMYDYFVVPGYTNIARVGLVNASTDGTWTNIVTTGIWNDTANSPSQTKWCMMGTTDPTMRTTAFASLQKTWADVNDAGYEGTVVPVSPYGSNGGNWQVRTVVDTTANGGEGSYSVFTRQVTSSDPNWWAGGDATLPGTTDWLAVPGLQNINCYFLTNGVDVASANAIYIRHRVRTWAFDNFLVETYGSAAPTYHPGDANGDGVIDLQDFGMLKDAFGMTTGATWGDGDFNADGAVDLQDFGILKDHFGHTNGDSPLAAVPEPASLTLLALGGLPLLRRRK